MKAKQVLYLGLILPALFLSACDSTPSARKGFVSELNEEEKKNKGEESIKLISFEKIHEQSGEVLGIETYRAKFEAKLAFPEGWNTLCNDKKTTVYCKLHTTIEPGKRKTIKGIITSEKTSEGWKKWSVRKTNFFEFD